MVLIFLAAVLFSFIFSPLGCIVLWKKYVNFGDGLSHASLLAATVAIASGLPFFYSVLLVATLFTTLIIFLKNTQDPTSAISFSSSLMISVAIIIAAKSPDNTNINNLLFGDIISVTRQDLIILLLIGLISNIYIISQYKKILLILLNKDLALIRGIKVKKQEFLFLFLLSITIFSTIKIVGSFLVISLLIIPAMAAKVFSFTPPQMIQNSIIIALIANVLGIYVAFYLDLPISPAIVVTNAGFYLTLLIIKKIKINFKY